MTHSSELLHLNYINNSRLKALHSAGIKTTEDLLTFFPRRYIDKGSITPLHQIIGKFHDVSIVVKVVGSKTTFRGRKRLMVEFTDNNYRLSAVWFHQLAFFQKILQPDTWVNLYGKVNLMGKKMTMIHPEIELLKDVHNLSEIKHIIPIYPSNAGFKKTNITHRVLNQWIKWILENVKLPMEFLPSSILKATQIPAYKYALWQIHFPETTQEYTSGQKRFKIAELLLFHMSIQKLKQTIKQDRQGIILNIKPTGLVNSFIAQLPFQLTNAQKKVIKEIIRDVKTGSQMNRMIQGDVGCGKTIVAVIAMLMAIEQGYQAAFMVPTTILALQHYHTITTWLKPFDISLRLLKGEQSTKLRREIYEDISQGRCHIVIGTHALQEKMVGFKNLGMVVIDEQHRFGVRQRMKLYEKGFYPHMMVTSATPIPRSLAMSLYGDLDISVIDELPTGRLPIKTMILYEKDRAKLYRSVSKHVDMGRQAYFVFPLVEESEKLDLEHVQSAFLKLKKQFPSYNIDIIHGKMTDEEKKLAMSQFSDGKTDILVATTVIEVGLDIPNAIIMVIEHPERYGLSQIHQLRGRIGRGGKQSFCVLMVKGNIGITAKQRLYKIVDTTDGFVISEFDLEMRGPGDTLGTKQHGLPQFKYSDIVKDRSIFEWTQKYAIRLLEQDIELNNPENQSLHKVFKPYFEERKRFYELL